LTSRSKEQPLIFAIDHVVFAAALDDRERIAGWIEGQGFRRRSFSLSFPGSGVSSESWSYGSGGFLEFVVENDRGAGNAEWFSVAPRVIGLGFASDDFESDTRWDGEDGSWRMNEDHVLPGGSVLTIEAAGPHLHASPFYVFVMKRPDGRLEFEPDPGAPRLTRIRLAGADADRWHENLARWLALPVDGTEIGVGDTLLEFVRTDDPRIAASLFFASRGGNATHALAAGSIAVEAGE
jgi:hypothetical protein